ncbi:hypothetical protein [Neorhizobium sp. T25_27]|uniref:hypothetical protein n=1 Tax=Neorhizobium sp. T25_27 TaxID=2093831 RepID=UPI00155EF4A3|nr:hypothetical protein [Neorhizobium sp. T25_27]
MSSLAVGADTIAADAALEVGSIELAVVMPLREEDYLDDFVVAGDREKYRSHLARAAAVFFPSEGLTFENRSEHYFRAGEFIAAKAQIVFAVWDGVFEQADGTGPPRVLRGGTADIVKICREGTRSTSLLALPEPTSLVHVMALREQSDIGLVEQYRSKVGMVQPVPKDDISGAQRIALALAAIDRFNQNVSKVGRSSSARSLVRYDSRLEGVFAQADELASRLQKQRLFGIRLVTFLTAVAVVLHQIYSGVAMNLGWLLLHLGAVFAALVAYGQFFRGSKRRDARFLDWRALAEGLRVQIFWSRAGGVGTVPDFYFSEDTDELEWLRHAVRNVIVTSKIDLAENDLVRIKYDWLIEQKEYFLRAAPHNVFYDRVFRWITRVSIGLGACATFVALLVHLLDREAYILNIVIFISAMFFLLAAVAKAYADQMAFAELAVRYGVMAKIFALAELRFSKAAAEGREDQMREVLCAAGKESLAENSAWVRSHRRRDLELNFN